MGSFSDSLNSLFLLKQFRLPAAGWAPCPRVRSAAHPENHFRPLSFWAHGARLAALSRPVLHETLDFRQHKTRGHQIGRGNQQHGGWHARACPQNHGHNDSQNKSIVPNLPGIIFARNSGSGYGKAIASCHIFESVINMRVIEIKLHGTFTRSGIP